MSAQRLFRACKSTKTQTLKIYMKQQQKKMHEATPVKIV